MVKKLLNFLLAVLVVIGTLTPLFLERKRPPIGASFEDRVNTGSHMDSYIAVNDAPPVGAGSPIAEDSPTEAETEEIESESVPLALLDKPEAHLDKTAHIAYIAGYPDGTIRGESGITRAETAAVFFKLADDREKFLYAGKSEEFIDVGLDKWYSEAVGYLVAAGVISGYSDGTFRGDSKITRAEFIAVSSHFAGSDMPLSPDEDVSFPFEDVMENYWAYDFIQSAYYLDWTSGYPDDTFRPEAPITRAEAITIVNKALGRKPIEPTTGEESPFTDISPKDWYYGAVMAAIER